MEESFNVYYKSDGNLCKVKVDSGTEEFDHSIAILTVQDALLGTGSSWEGAMLTYIKGGKSDNT